MPVTIYTAPQLIKGRCLPKAPGELWRHSSLLPWWVCLHIHGHRPFEEPVPPLWTISQSVQSQHAESRCGKRPRPAVATATQAARIAYPHPKSPGPHYGNVKPSHAYLITHVKAPQPGAPKCWRLARANPAQIHRMDTQPFSRAM